MELSLPRLHHRSRGQVENSPGKREEAESESEIDNSPKSPDSFTRSNSGTYPRDKGVDELLQAGSNQQAMSGTR